MEAYYVRFRWLIPSHPSHSLYQVAKNTKKNELLRLRSECAAIIERGLREVTGDRTARMAYSQYHEQIILPYGVHLTWPKNVPFRAPSTMGTSRAQITTLADGLGLTKKSDGAVTVKWVKLSPAEVKEKDAEYTAQLEAAAREHGTDGDCEDNIDGSGDSDGDNNNDRARACTQSSSGARTLSAGKKRTRKQQGGSAKRRRASNKTSPEFVSSDEDSGDEQPAPPLSTNTATSAGRPSSLPASDSAPVVSTAAVASTLAVMTIVPAQATVSAAPTAGNIPHPAGL